MGIVGLLFILFSFLGFSHWLREKFSLDPGIIPFILATSYIFIIALGARFSLMLASLLITNIFGLYLFIKSFKKLDLYRDFFPKYLIFFVAIICLAFYLRDKIFLLYDEFSHWATISRLLIKKDAINTALDTVIDFKSYPQTGAYFIYGLVRPVGYAESHMMLANAIFTLSGAFAYFLAVKRKIIDYIIGILVIIFALVYNIRPYGLLVDTILATTSFGIFVYMDYIKDHDDKKRLRYFLIPMFVSLIYIKNSALVLAAFLIIYMLVSFGKNGLDLVGISLASIVLANRSWSNHIKNNFENTGRHSISLSSYKSGLESSKDLVEEFTKNFLRNIRTDYLMWALLIGLIILVFVCLDKQKLIKLIVYTFIVYALYQTGNYFMYLTSMDAGEIKRLACYDRYVRTIHIYLLLINLYVINKNYQGVFAKIFTALLLIFASFIIRTPEEIRLPERSFRENLIEIKKKDHIEPGKSILIKFEKRDNTRIFTRAAMFSFDTSEVTDTFPGDEKEYKESDFDYFIDLSK